MAKEFADEERIFFPHSMDFRGRMYPLPPILNHMGGDLSRGLLVFSEGKELGQDGLDNLMVGGVVAWGKFGWKRGF